MAQLSNVWAPRFEDLPYQSDAVRAVVNVFKGQESKPDRQQQDFKKESDLLGALLCVNPELSLSEEKLLKQINDVQQQGKIEQSPHLWKAKRGHVQACAVNLDVEMETGTGKTYVYTKTAYELYKKYGWGKFIIIVPSVAIREGVKASLEGTLTHLAKQAAEEAKRRGEKTNDFNVNVTVYNSARLSDLWSYVQDDGLQLLVMNIQAFNTKSEESRKIHRRQEDFGYMKPLDALKACRPILILDEPQKMEGKATEETLPLFNPLFILRYSATHKTVHDLVYRLDAIDAFHKQLVKQISVTGFNLRGTGGQAAYVYLSGVRIQDKGAPQAVLEIEVKRPGGTSRRTILAEMGTDLFAESGQLAQYADRYIVNEIKVTDEGGSITFLNGLHLEAGDIESATSGDVAQEILREAQIRETIREHFRTEERNFPKGIKTLTLFFLDKVANYRDYNQPDEKGPDVERFERIYKEVLEEEKENLLMAPSYRAYLDAISAEETHKGYFCEDKRSKRFVDVERPGENQVDAYDLILKDKERLLSLSTREPETKVRFIFSHSALREGWDNPNVFQICMFKKFDPKSSSTIALRQEVGRGLRLCVTENGARYHKGAVHDVNQLTVITAGPGKEYVAQLQKEIAEASKNRPHLLKPMTFKGVEVKTPSGLTAQLDKKQSEAIAKWAQTAGYIDETGAFQSCYLRARKSNTVVPLPSSPNLIQYTDDILKYMDDLATNTVQIKNPRATQPLRCNQAVLNKREFQELISGVVREAFYEVQIDTEKLIRQSLNTLNSEGAIKVPPLMVDVSKTTVDTDASFADFQRGQAVREVYSASMDAGDFVSTVKYDLVGELADEAATGLTRKTIVRILQGMKRHVLELFTQNPPAFISEVTRCINNAKVDMVVEGLHYAVNEQNPKAAYDIFAGGAQILKSRCEGVTPLAKHIYRFVDADSQVEMAFARALDNAQEVIVFAKLPKSFQIPTPMGNYSPDWAIAFDKQKDKSGITKRCIYFVAETKGDTTDEALRGTELRKIKCAKKYFERLRQENFNVEYDAVTSWKDLCDGLLGKRRKDLLSEL